MRSRKKKRRKMKKKKKSKIKKAPIKKGPIKKGPIKKGPIKKEENCNYYNLPLWMFISSVHSKHFCHAYVNNVCRVVLVAWMVSYYWIMTDCAMP
jgi:hypothetical protein